MKYLNIKFSLICKDNNFITTPHQKEKRFFIYRYKKPFFFLNEFQKNPKSRPETNW